VLNVDNAIAIYLLVFLAIMLAVCAIGRFTNRSDMPDDEVRIPPAPPENE
jgi:hypothetical protein